MPRPRGNSTEKYHARFSPLEMLALDYIGGQRGKNQLLRKLVWFFMLNSSEFDVSAFTAHVQKEVLPTLGRGAAKDLAFELDSLKDERSKPAKDSESSMVSAAVLGDWLKDAQD